MVPGNSIKGDRAVVVLNRRAPTAFALEELAFSKEDGRVLRVLPECARELRLGGVRIPEVDERVPEPEDGARVVRSDFEDCMKQQDGFFRMTVSPQLFRLLHDVSGVRRARAERLRQGFDRRREPAQPEGGGRALV